MYKRTSVWSLLNHKILADLLLPTNKKLPIYQSVEVTAHTLKVETKESLFFPYFSLRSSNKSVPTAFELSIVFSANVPLMKALQQFSSKKRSKTINELPYHLSHCVYIVYVDLQQTHKPDSKEVKGQKQLFTSISSLKLICISQWQGPVPNPKL